MAERGRPCGSVPSDERRGAPYSPASRRRSRRDRWLRRRSRERGCAASACSWEAQTTLGQTRSTPLMQGLGALNWHDGGNLHIDWRWAGGDPVLYERYAAELIALDPEVLVAWGSPNVAALRRQTSTIPIVIVNVTDPVGQGFVQSLARPGGNITGFTDYDPPMAGKWLGMLTQIIPPVARVAVLFNPATAPFAGLMVRVIKESAPSLAVAVRAAPCRDDAEIEAMMAGLAREERRSADSAGKFQHCAQRRHYHPRCPVPSAC